MKIAKDDGLDYEKPFLTETYFNELVIDLSDELLKSYYDLASSIIDKATLNPLKPIRVEIDKKNVDEISYLCNYITNRKEFDPKSKSLIIDPQDDEIIHIYSFNLAVVEELQRRGIRLSRRSNRHPACGSLQLNLMEGVLQYGDNPPIPVSPNTSEIKLLALLMKHQNIVRNEYVASELNLSGIPVQYTETSEQIKHIVKKIRKLLVEAGMSKELVKSTIRASRKAGYRMYCPD